ncbi:5-oxoprolinase subunit PxpA [Aliidiomarina celeris]|uniref:5-oxoprolinase subunit PxpA n=1 Tax=Aliidiomarina celeris TaxID=2249428 RepID=UPI000DE81D8D|nr:5-oxoprolinase subunit PxpA [Aliidiomarina celeris]
MSRQLLLNADLGESFGAWRMGNDEALMPLIDCANIATGFHASDPLTMSRTVALAAQHRVQIGAHPAYPDKEGFGRRSMACSAEEITAMVCYQIGAIAGMCRAHGSVLSYVKPHGALYNDMMNNATVFAAVLQGITDFDPSLPCMVLATPELEQLRSRAAEFGLTLWGEAFADRAYTDEGRLMPRTQAGSVYHERARILEQARQLAEEGRVRTVSGRSIALEVETLCVHGDNPESVATVADIRQLLKRISAA